MQCQSSGNRGGHSNEREKERASVCSPMAHYKEQGMFQIVKTVLYQVTKVKLVAMVKEVASKVQVVAKAKFITQSK